MEQTKKFNKKIIFIFLLSIVFLIFTYVGISYYLNSEILVVSSKNVSKVEIINESGKIVANFSENNKSLRLTKAEYKIKYTGSEDFASGEISKKVDKRTEVNIEPKYSEAKLRSILKDSRSDIISDLNSQLTLGALYKVSEGMVYDFGEWYGTTLIYTGPDFYNADSLRLVMKKESEKWILMTNPPSIVLTKNQHPNIPEEVLEATNNQEAPIDQRYTATD